MNRISGSMAPGPGVPGEVMMRMGKANKEETEMMQKNSKSGFTLIELMVVAVIIAILAAVAIPLMSGNKLRAAATEAQAGCGVVKTALRQAFAEDGQLPASTADVTTLPGINAIDLNGKYFQTDGYAVVVNDQADIDGYVITATADYPSDTDIDGKTVVLTGATSDFSGTMLD